MRKILLVTTAGAILVLMTLTSAQSGDKATHDLAVITKGTAKIELESAKAQNLLVEVGENNPVAKYQATCVSGGPGRAHANRTWDGPKRDKSADAQKDADAHDKADPNKKCQAWVATVD